MQLNEFIVGTSGVTYSLKTGAARKKSSIPLHMQIPKCVKLF